MALEVSIDSFLSQVLPTRGLYCASYQFPKTAAAAPNKFYGWVNQVKPTVRDVAITCLEKSAEGAHAYFALASYTRDKYPCPTGALNSAGKPKMIFRVAANACAVRSVWIDIDCGPGKHYEKQADAARAFYNFKTSLGLPCPMVVNSGYGLHLYWVMQDDMDVEQWERLSRALATCAGHFGLRSDYGVTTDIARVLRPPQTKNYKHGAERTVEVVFQATITSYTEMGTILAAYMNQHNLTAITPGKVETLTPEMASNPALAAIALAQGAAVDGGLPDVPNKNAARILTHCEQMRESAHRSYDLWIASMSVFLRCENGREAALAHYRTGGEEKFSQADFDAKWEKELTLEGGGTAYCDTFERANPGICANCTHRGKIKTPAQLGVLSPLERREEFERASKGAGIIEVTPVPVNAPQTTAAASLPPGQPSAPPPGDTPPAPGTAPEIKGIMAYPLKDETFFLREGEGVYEVYEKALYDENNKKTGETIPAQRLILNSCPHLMYSVRAPDGKSRQHMTYMFLITTRGKPPRQASFTVDDVKSPSALFSWLYENQMLPEPNCEAAAGRFMRTYIAKLQNVVKCVDMKEHFGWSKSVAPDGTETPNFVLGERLLLPKQPVTKVMLSRTMSAQAEPLHARGTLEQWKLVPQFYEVNNIIWGQLGMALAFAAPLMHLCPGIATNGIVSFWADGSGTASGSGTGKTTLQHCINSVFGHPEELLLTTQSTANSRFGKMGMRRNLPICINEITNLIDVELSDTLFQISEGREKDRMSDGGKGYLTAGRWNTITILTANNTIFNKMMSVTKSRDAEIKRVLEIEAKKSTASPSDANKMIAVMNENYGVAGEFFVQKLLDNPAVLGGIPKAISDFVDKHLDNSDERYWINTLACAVVAAKLANAMGLTNINIQAVIDMVLQSIRATRNDLVEVQHSVRDSITEYCMDNLRSILMVSDKNVPASIRTADDRMRLATGYIIRMPSSDQLNIRVVKETGECRVRGSSFTEWCKKRGISPAAALEGYLPREEVKLKSLRIGGGTQSMDIGPVKGYEFYLPKAVVDILATPEGVAPGQPQAE